MEPQTWGEVLHFFERRVLTFLSPSRFLYMQISKQKYLTYLKNTRMLQARFLAGYGKVTSIPARDRLSAR
jgi:hypothetical protein